MTFLAPGFFFASLAVAAVVVALHFIVTRQPRAGILPTARFIPDLPATATARATRPSDLLLMLLRVALVLAAGAGLAKPVFKPSRGVEARVILADVSRSSQDSTALRDSVRRLYRDHDIIVAFDSSARIVSTADSINALRPSGARGNLSAAFIAAMRAASSLRDRADSIDLVVVSPFAREEFDEATGTARQLWPGHVRLVRVPSSLDTVSSRRSLDLKSDGSDPLQTTVGLARSTANANATIVRNGAAVTNEPRAIVDWPVSERPRGAIARAKSDTIGGVIAGDAIVISAFARRWAFPSDSLRNAEVIARWVDGEPAAIEIQNGSGCSRSVAIPVNPLGDLVIRSDFVALVDALSGDCIGRASLVPADPSQISQLAGTGRLAPREAFKPRADVRSKLAPWLIALAIGLALLELIVRRRRTAARAMSRVRQNSEARAA